MADEQTTETIAADIAATVAKLQALQRAHWDAQTRTSVLLEDGSRADTKPYQAKERRAFGLTDHVCYEHVADAPDGEWIYRDTNA